MLDIAQSLRPCKLHVQIKKIPRNIKIYFIIIAAKIFHFKRKADKVAVICISRYGDVCPAVIIRDKG